MANTEENMTQIGVETEQLDDETESNDRESYPLNTAKEHQQLLNDFVALYGGMKQRDASWYESMATTVGGSEIAALLGMNPYSSFYKVVQSKITLMSGQSDFEGGVACWWGSLFEDVVAQVVEVDLGAPVCGDDICIRDLPGHRNSPDGYVVVKLYNGVDGRDHIWTTNRAEHIISRSEIALLEFKCPLSRKPTGTIPRQYKPQVWSGLMVSPIARSGLFVDSVYRKCALADLNGGPEYDTIYHMRDRGSVWEGAYALGLIGVYAPRNDAAPHVRYGWKGEKWTPADGDIMADNADAAQAAWFLHMQTFHKAPAATADATPIDVMDLGDVVGATFETVMSLIDRRAFKTRRIPPCFLDGRGHNLRSNRAIQREIWKMQREAPPGYWLMAVLPWKLFEMNYSPLDRRPGFEAEVLPLIDEVHAIVRGAVAARDPRRYLETEVPRFAQVRVAMSAKANEITSDVQDLFDQMG